MIENKKIVILASAGDSTTIVHNAINNKFSVHTVFIEQKENKKIFIKRRIKRLGIVKVAGQLIFQVFIAKTLHYFSAKRIKEIIQKEQLDINAISPEKIIFVRSVNEDKVKEMLQRIDPALVIVNGTRIISKKILSAVNCNFINTHTGITPMYRGVHGGYWALVKNDKAHCGVTIHQVDAGIDTGDVLYNDTIEITKKDNFSTYPYLQTSKGLPLLLNAVEDALQNKLKPLVANGVSALYYHPTVWQYLYYRIFKKVK